MRTEVFLPHNSLTDFISGYFFSEVDTQEDLLELKKFESGISLGVSLGKPFEFVLHETGKNCNELKLKLFDHPLLFTEYDTRSRLLVKGQLRLVFIVFTPFGVNLLINQQNPQFDEPFIPLSRLGLPLFNLLAKRKLRFNQNTPEGIRLIDDELRRFYLKESNLKKSNDFISPSIYPFYPTDTSRLDEG